MLFSPKKKNQPTELPSNGAVDGPDSEAAAANDLGESKDAPKESSNESKAGPFSHSAMGAVNAREAELRECAIGMANAQNIKADNSVIFMASAQKIEGENTRVIVTAREAAIWGAAAGLIVVLLGFLFPSRG